MLLIKRKNLINVIILLNVIGCNTYNNEEIIEKVRVSFEHNKSDFYKYMEWSRDLSCEEGTSLLIKSVRDENRIAIVDSDSDSFLSERFHLEAKCFLEKAGLIFIYSQCDAVIFYFYGRNKKLNDFKLVYAETEEKLLRSNTEGKYFKNSLPSNSDDFFIYRIEENWYIISPSTSAYEKEWLLTAPVRDTTN